MNRIFKQLLGAALATAIALGAVGAVPVGAHQHRSSRQVEHIARDLHQRLNDERAARGLHALPWDDQLTNLAADWSAEMADTGRYEHRDMEPVMRAGLSSRWAGIGENIFEIPAYYESAGYAHERWLASDGHRVNMLNRGYDAVGIGIVCAPDGTMYATQNFGRVRDSSRPPLDQHPPPSSPVARPAHDGPTCAEHLAGVTAAGWQAQPRVRGVAASHDRFEVAWSPASGRVTGYLVRTADGQEVQAPADATRITLPRPDPDQETDVTVHVLDGDGKPVAGPSTRWATTKPPTDPPGGVDHERSAGPGRVETAVAVSRRSFASGSRAVVLARADAFADALAGAPLAAAARGPVLLTGRSSLDNAVRDEIARLRPSTVYVLGGEAAVSAAAVAALPTGRVVRIAGRDRLQTAANVAAETARVAGRSDTVFIADGGRGWPDAVSAGALAARLGAPLLLSAGATLGSPTREAVLSAAASRAVVVGGTAVVPPSVVDELERLGLSVERLAGRDRYATASAVRDAAVDSGADAGRVWVTTLSDWPDALAAGAAAAAGDGVLLGVSGKHPRYEPSDASRWIEATARGDHGSGVSRIDVVGGQTAVWDSFVHELFHAVEAGAPVNGGLASLLPLP